MLNAFVGYPQKQTEITSHIRPINLMLWRLKINVKNKCITRRFTVASEIHRRTSSCKNSNNFLLICKTFLEIIWIYEDNLKL